VKIYTHNFNINSNSGPNKFTRQLFRKMGDLYDIEIMNDQKACDIEFCLIMQQSEKLKPRLTRLDGIYFNIDQEFDKLNSPIRYTYDYSDAVIFQSEFNKKLIENWFFDHQNGHVIHNGADLDYINLIGPSCDKIGVFNLDDNVEVWSCASNWRPHKRLKDNIDYFISFAPKNAIFIIAGLGAQKEDFEKYSDLINKRIFYAGEIDYNSLICLYKRSKVFVHLAFLDHCPNVVVDAQACGCKIICSSTGGTSEIVTIGRIIKEDPWDFQPIKLYEPPSINFNSYHDIVSDNEHNLKEASLAYYEVMNSILN